MEVKIRLSKGRLFKVWGHRIMFPEYPNFKFAVNPYINNDEEYTGNYTVTELTSGAPIAIRPTVKSAILYSRKMLHEKGTAEIASAIEKYIKKFGSIQ